MHFNAMTHQYTIGGRPVPSVTQVLGDILPGWKAGEWYLNRGTVVHACAAMIAKGQKFEHDPQVDGQVRACRSWFADFAPTVVAAEEGVYSRTYQYAGTMDLLAYIDGRLTAVDWKASLVASATWQLAAYALAYEEMHKVKVGQAVAVALYDSGAYKMGLTISGTNFGRAKREWLSLLTSYKLRQKHLPKESGNGAE